MLRDLSEVKKIRRKLGLTQIQLAEEAGVSQSLIAKIESNTTVPSFENGKKILNTLEKLMIKDKNIGAKDIHTSDLIYLRPDDKVEDALRTMNEKAISQLPIINQGVSIGSITEKGLLNNFGELSRDEKLRKIMEPSFPLLDIDVDIELVKEILRYYPAVLTSERGDVKGIITKADLISEI